ncbi:hypothetical protein [Nocardia coubleae]|uniref:Integral membrane protein n=1 Tax=Nocardia coubleae TaxID=356147 RepID=A0A846W5A0_9NOCA|nr:hypothetical protein [Nocardia coubleae]NKX88459.1 hypothetical protein [Nocardia coubleae]
MTAVRALSGVVAGGVVALLCVVVGAALIGARRDFPGPGGESLTWHVLVTVVVVGAQIVADRRRGVAALAGSAVVFVMTGALLWTQWWG